MALNIRNTEAERLADELARRTGETKSKRCAALPVLDPTPPDEILGYDDKGLPR